MPRLRRRYFPVVSIVISLVSALANVAGVQAAPPTEKFELRDGDRVVFLGNTLIEREQTYGYLETAPTERYPDRNITFRNLGWSGDTVWGEARAQFGTPADGFKQLKEHVLALKPTVIFVGYGTNESFAGQAGLPHFLDGLKTLLDVLDQTHARIVILSPLRMENLGPPLPDPTEQNKRLEIYSAALGKVAGERGYWFVDLFHSGIVRGDARSFSGSRMLDRSTVPPHMIDDRPHFTDDEIHLTEEGYWRFAEEIEFSLVGIPERWEIFADATRNRVYNIGFQMSDSGVKSNIAHLKVTDSNLPLPCPDPEGTGDYGHRLDRKLRADGLQSGKYELKIDGTTVLTSTADELAKGVWFSKGPSFDQAVKLRQAIVHKNELYFNRWRPQNVTYLFLFRAHEQGNNAVEIPKFDPLVEEAEKEIAKLRVPQPHAYELTPAKEGAK